MISDHGRSHPYVFRLDPGPVRDAVTGASPVATPNAQRSPWREAAVDRVLGTDAGRAPGALTLDGRRDPRDLRAPRRSVVAGRTPSTCRRCASSRRPGAGGPIDVWIASPPGAGDAALPAVVDVHGGPLGAWAPAPHIEVMLSSRTATASSCRTSAVRPRTARLDPPAARRLGRGRCRRRPRAVDHVVAIGLADPDRLGVMGLSYGGFMTNWLVGTTDPVQGGRLRRTA